MKKILSYLIIFIYCFSLSPLEAIPGHEDKGHEKILSSTRTGHKALAASTSSEGSSLDDNTEPSVALSPETEHSLDVNDLIRRIDSLESELAETKGEFKRTLKRILRNQEDTPLHRRMLRAHMGMYLPLVIGFTYYIWTGDLSTAVTLTSCIFSIAMVLITQMYKVDDSYYPVTRTRDKTRTKRE